VDGAPRVLVEIGGDQAAAFAVRDDARDRSEVSVIVHGRGEVREGVRCGQQGFNEAQVRKGVLHGTMRASSDGCQLWIWHTG
jgi:hypothetical protein